MRRRLLHVTVALAGTLALAACSAGSTSGGTATTEPHSAASIAAPVSITPTPASSPVVRSSAPSRRTHSATATRRPTPGRVVPSASRIPREQVLPLHYSYGDANQVITVVAASGSSTTATLQRWAREGQGWDKVGHSVRAYLGDTGIGQASESSDTTPTGSYTLTQAFGRQPDPGTALPYTRTTPADWWISQPGPLYNTRQRCSTNCGFSQGDPNEHLYYETPFYEYAVVIDYNTRNAPGGVRPGAGSAFFLHVTVHEPTQGCVSIDEDDLVRVLRWLDPAQHPRIMLGIR